MDRNARILLATGLLLAAGLIVFEAFQGRELAPDAQTAALAPSQTQTISVPDGQAAASVGTAVEAPPEENTVVNINTATREELTKLPGVGPAKAEAIIAYREENGPFRTVDELSAVKGIGEKTLERLRTFATVG